MPIFFGDPFKKRLIVKPTDKQLADMIEANIEDYSIYSESDMYSDNKKTTISINDSWWNRRKLKKLKISFKKS